MHNSLLLYKRRLCLILLLTLGQVLLFVPRGAAQSPPPDPKTPQTPSTTEAPTEAQKKAAERKKRFEEQKKLLEGGGGAGPGAAKHAPVTDTEFWIDPIGLNMLANESQEIHVWDRRGNDVSARVSWSLTDSGIVDMEVKNHAIISAKMPGTVSVIAMIDGHTVEAIVTVYRGTELPPGTERTVVARPVLNHGGRHTTTTVIESPN